MSVATAIVLAGFALSFICYDAAPDRVFYGALFSFGITWLYELWAYGILTADEVWSIISGEAQ
jgi:hypothetical protein